MKLYRFSCLDQFCLEHVSFDVLQAVTQHSEPLLPTAFIDMHFAHHQMRHSGQKLIKIQVSCINTYTAYIAFHLLLHSYKFHFLRSSSNFSFHFPLIWQMGYIHPKEVPILLVVVS